MPSNSIVKAAIAAVAFVVAQAASAGNAMPEPSYIVPGIGTLLTWFSVFR